MGFGNPFGGFDSALGGLFGGGGKDPGKKRYADVMALYAQLQSQQNAGYGKAYGQQKKALGAIQTGFQGAIDNASRVGASSKQGVLDREQQSMGALSQSLTDRGLFNTTAFDNARRGISSDTNKSLSSIDAAIAQLQGGLLAQKGQAEAGAYGNLAGLQQNWAGAQTGLGLSKVASIEGVQDQNTDWLGQLFQTGAQFLPFLM